MVLHAAPYLIFPLAALYLLRREESVRERERISFRIPRNTYYLGLIRKAVVEVARRAGFSVSATAEIEMAVDEACSNAIRHSGGGSSGPSDSIAFDAVIDEAGIVVTVADGGAPFPFDKLGTADIESYLSGREVGGLGVYIIKRFMDEVHYCHRPEVGNELRMRKYLEVGDASQR